MDATHSWTPSTMEAMIANSSSPYETSLKHTLGDIAGSLGAMSGDTGDEDEYGPDVLCRELYPPMYIDDDDPFSQKAFPGSLVNPTIALEDVEDSFTPATLDEMLAHQASPHEQKRLRFLDLPAEIRNLVYAELLTPDSGAAIDFAPCADCAHETTDATYFRLLAYPVESVAYYAMEWRQIRWYPRVLSLVSRQVRDEADSLFWSQPFRFTGDVGWIMLYHFLKRIGPANVRRLKNLTVCHPAFCLTPDYYPEREERRLRRNYNSNFNDYYGLFDDHLGRFALGKCMGRRSYAELSVSADWRSHDAFDGPVRLLAGAESLIRLAFVLPQFQPPEDQPCYKDLHLHPVHTIEWPQGDRLSISILNLISSTQAKGHHHQLSLDDIYANERGAAMLPTTSLADPKPPQYHHEPERAQLARSYLEKVKEMGWQVHEAMYDRLCQYPVKAGRRCVNQVACKALMAYDAFPYGEQRCIPYAEYACPGTREEVLAHEGLERTKERITYCLRSGEWQLWPIWGDWVEWGDWVGWVDEDGQTAVHESVEPDQTDVFDDDEFELDWSWLEGSQ